MKMTLLEIVQAILASMDSEEINSITDTAESNQVALICKGVYYDILNDVDIPNQHSLFQLEPSGDSAKPVLMYTPDNIFKIEQVRYNCLDTEVTDVNYKVMQFITWDDFMARQAVVEPTDSTYDTMTITLNSLNYIFRYRNNANPIMYTTFDDHTLIFDSYDNTLDTTLQKSKTMCTGRGIPAFTMDDSFTPQFDANQFPYYVNKIKSRAFNELKQQVNQEAAAETRRQKIMQQKRKNKTEDRPAVLDHARWGKQGFLNGTDSTIPRNLRSGS